MVRRKITVHRKGYRRKGYHRKAYTRADGTRVKAADVGPARIGPGTYKRIDVGKPGKTPLAKRWAVFETRTGWKKTQSPTTRRRKLVASCERTTYRRKGYTYRRAGKRVKVKPAIVRSDVYLCAARKANQLANVTVDKVTKRLARQDAKVLFKKAKVTT